MPPKSTMDLSEFDSLVGKIYDASLDTSQWQVFMEHLVGSCNAKSSLLRVQNLQDKSVSAWFSHGMNPDFRPKYIEHFVKVDPIIPFLATLPVGKMVQTAEDMQGEEFRGSEYFNDYLIPQEMEHLAGGFLFRSDALVVAFGIHKSEHMGAFTHVDMDRFKLLAPHMQRAVQVNRHLLRLEKNSNAIGDALDRLPVSIVLVDMNGLPVFSNQQARMLSLKKNGLSIKSNGLATISGSNLKAVQKLIYQAVNSTTKQGGVHVVQQPGSRRPLTVLVTPINDCHQFDLGADCSNVAAALFISKPDQGIEFPLDVLNCIYGLTPSESRLVVALVNGKSINRIAEQLTLSKNTVRNHLKSCFRKTGTRRQSELVALILSEVPVLVDKQSDF